jgi:hypothetical protein
LVPEGKCTMQSKMGNVYGVECTEESVRGAV